MTVIRRYYWEVSGLSRMQMILAYFISYFEILNCVKSFVKHSIVKIK